MNCQEIPQALYVLILQEMQKTLNLQEMYTICFQESVPD